MKFEKTFILLIIMSLFLLVSIGSVCAEDMAADANVQSTDVEEVDDLAVDPDNQVVEDTQPEKINTTITATGPSEKIKDDADKNITVTVKDNNSQEITNLTKSNFTIIDKNNSDKKIENFIYNNSTITIKEKLASGEHNLLIWYLGNANYTNSSTSILLKIFGNNTLVVPDTVDTNTSIVEIPINLTDGIDDNTALLNSSSTKVQLRYGNNIYIIDDINWTEVAKNNTIIMNITTYNIPNDTNRIPANLTINYTEGNKILFKTVAIKWRTQVILTPNVINITEGENATIHVEVLGADGKLINVTGKNFTISNATGATSKSFNRTSGNLTIVGLKKGFYNITLAFKGNYVNNTSFARILVYVRGTPEINTNGTAINVNSSKIGKIQIINVTNGIETFDFSKENLNITVTYKDGNDTRNIAAEWDLVNGTITFTLDNANFTTATLTINYTSINGTGLKNITLNRIYNAKIEVVTNENEYNDDYFKFRLVDVDDNSILVGKSISLNFINANNVKVPITVTTDKDGIASFKTSDMYFVFENNSIIGKYLVVGSYGVELYTNNPIKSTTLKTNLTVTKANIALTIDPFKEYWGTSKKVKVTVTYSKSGNPVVGTILKLYMPKTSGKYHYIQTNSNGIGEIVVSGLIPGDYELTVSNNDTKNINNKSAKTTVSILKKPIQINVKVGTMYYNSGKTATIKITDKNTGKAVSGVYFLVQFDKNSNKTYLFQTNSKGQISFSDSLNVGKHKIVVANADTRYDGKTVTKSFTVKKASATIKAPKVTDYYKGVKYFTVKLVNSKNKKPIYDAKINIKIFVTKNKYYNYNGKTGANGQIRLILDSLKPGKYKVEVSGDDNKNFVAKMVTSKIVIKKAPTKLTPKKLTAKKGAKKYFQVKVTNKKTKKVIKGVKVKIKVYTGKKAKTFKAKTNAKGIAKILTNKLKVGKHKVIVTSANKYCVAKKAKSTIKIKK